MVTEEALGIVSGVSSPPEDTTPKRQLLLHKNGMSRTGPSSKLNKRWKYKISQKLKIEL